MKIDISSNIKEIENKLGFFQQKQMPFIIRTATNNIAFDVQDTVAKSVYGSLKWKKKLNIKGVTRVKKATKSNPFAEVYLDDGGTGKTNWGYYALKQHFTGDDRHRKGMEKDMIRVGYMKRYEILTPSPGVTIKPSTYVQMISQLKISSERGYSANETKKSRAKKPITSVRYFIATSKINLHLAPGVYARVPGIENPICMLRISEKPTYKKRFDFKEITQKVINRRLDSHFSKAFEYAMSTAK